MDVPPLMYFTCSKSVCNIQLPVSVDLSNTEVTLSKFSVSFTNLAKPGDVDLIFLALPNFVRPQIFNGQMFSLVGVYSASNRMLLDHVAPPHPAPCYPTKVSQIEMHLLDSKLNPIEFKSEFDLNYFVQLSFNKSYD